MYAEVGVQALYRSYASRYRRNGFALAAQPLDILGKFVGGHGRERKLRMLVYVRGKLPDITHIGAKGVCRGMLFVCEILFKKLYAFFVIQSKLPLSFYLKIKYADIRLPAADR